MLVVRNKQRDAEEVREMPEHLVSLFSDPPKMVRRLTYPRPLATAMQTVKSRIGLCTNQCVKLVRLNESSKFHDAPCMLYADIEGSPLYPSFSVLI